MRYMFLICAETAEIAEDDGHPDRDPTSWVKEMDGRGVRSIGERLASPEDATTVRVRDGQLLLTDGPFVETKELICGFDLIDCADLDEAIEIASKHPMARWGMVEVRPFWTPPPRS
ncbi:MAG TPA: YciI family protein [Acidimicrobiales bacterium]|nr:YciI family protein [Acidimicrobiales bacterium]